MQVEQLRTALLEVGRNDLADDLSNKNKDVRSEVDRKLRGDCYELIQSNFLHDFCLTDIGYVRRCQVVVKQLDRPVASPEFCSRVICWDFESDAITIFLSQYISDIDIFAGTHIFGGADMFGGTDISLRQN